MDPRTRDLCFQIFDGRLQDQTIWVFLNVIRHMARCNEILGWIVRHRMTGANFTGWVRDRGFTPLELCRAVLKRLDSDVVPRPILRGRDYLG